MKNYATKSIRNIVLLGGTRSGKTTFAEKFAKKFNLAYYNLDEIREEYGFSHEAVLSVLEIITKASLKNITVTSINEFNKNNTQGYNVTVKVKDKETLDNFVDILKTYIPNTNLRGID